MYDRSVLEECQAVFGGGKVVSSQKAGGRSLQESWLWRIDDGYLIQAILRRLLRYMSGDKRQQGYLFRRFVDRKLALYERRTAEGRSSYTREERLELYQLARVCRDMAGGGAKGWKKTWDTRIKELAA